MTTKAKQGNQGNEKAEHYKQKQRDVLHCPKKVERNSPPLCHIPNSR
jgi:hypothetical protein